MPFYLFYQLIDELLAAYNQFPHVSDEKADIIDSINVLLDLTEIEEDENIEEKIENLTMCTIIFEANGGTGVMPNKSIYHGKSKMLPRNKYKREGYDFQGWTKEKGSSIVHYSDRSRISINDKNTTTLVLYAVWKIQTFKIEYKANGGAGSMASATKDYGTKYKLDPNKFTRKDYLFLGWSTNSSKTTADYKDQQEITVKSNLVLYAIWKLNQVTITYNANGGSGTMAAKTVIVGTTVTLDDNKFTRTDYIFKGWATSASGSVAFANKAQIKSIAQNYTLYAVWERSLVVYPASNARAWNACSKASCWHGDNAQERIMNILSPNMGDGTFNSRYNWSKNRGVNCFHLFISNNRDGEYAGYSIYGNSASGNISSSYTRVMGNRIKRIFNDGYGVILWLMADDDGGWNNTHLRNFDKYCRDIKSLGWLPYCSTICLGLEINESVGSSANIKSMATTLKKYYGGKIGVHFGSRDQYDRASGTGVDIIFGQITPSEVSESRIRSDIERGKRYASAFNMFEISRHDSRSMAQYALNHGAYGVGNW